MTAASPAATHEVFNQSTPWADVNLFTTNQPLQDALRLQPAAEDPLAELRSALSPVSESSKAKPVRLAQGLHTSLADKSSSSPSTYLGALL